MNRTSARQTGMSLVELMVGMAIGLIGVVIITHLYLTNEEYKRSTTGAGTAQVNGAIALYLMERDLRMAGYGFAHSGALGCTCAGAGCSPIQYYYNGTYSFPPAGSAAGAQAALSFAPIVITETAGAADSITVLYSTDEVRSLPGSLSEDMASAGADFKVDGTSGFEVNDMLVLAQGSTCMLTQVTQVQASASQLSHGSSSLWNPVAGGTLPSFTQGAYAFNLGQPTWRTYSISSNNLRSLEVLTAPAGGTAVNLLGDIVDLQAEYGKDDGGGGGTADDGKVDTWNSTTPTTSADWQRVLAVRVAVLARSPNFVKPATAGADCDATTAQPSWSGGSFVAKNFSTTSSEDRCYKYRVFETVIPLRNMIWRAA